MTKYIYTDSLCSISITHTLTNKDGRRTPRNLEKKSFYAMLVRDMSPELVAKELYNDSILTIDMKETILMQLTRLAKSRKILEFLPKRGKRVFNSVCLALEKTGHPQLALELKQEKVNSHKETASPTTPSMSYNEGKIAPKNFTQ